MVSTVHAVSAWQCSIIAPARDDVGGFQSPDMDAFASSWDGQRASSPESPRARGAQPPSPAR